jgi:hypothetical protein
MSCPSWSVTSRSGPVTDLPRRPVAIYVQSIYRHGTARHGTDRLRRTPSPWYSMRMVQDLVAALDARKPAVV